MNLKDKKALVTGGAHRLGKATALELASRGCHICIHYGQSEARAAETCRELEALGVKAEQVQADLSDHATLEQMLAEASEKMGGLDILVNNAAIFPEDDHFTNMNSERWDALMDINLRAPVFLAQAFARQCADRPGAIINLIDARYNNTDTDHFIYRLGKHALAEATKMLALELAPNIRVNGVAPGAILPPPGKGQDFLERNKSGKVPLATVGSAERIAENVAHLLSQPFLTGVIIPVDGGEFL